MLERVAEFITRYNMLPAGGRIAVAVSGGADSVCLLHVLLELAPRWDLRLSVLHLNHNLRGAESDGDEGFVRELAQRLGVPLSVKRWNANGERQSHNLEEAAREARLAFFAETIAAGEADRIAVGHTRSDQAETVLFRLLRGAGTAGLAGIRPVTSGGIVRPLLAVERSDVEEYLRSRAIPWREDSTNRSRQFARNRIRHELLPRLASEWNPAIGETLANMADWAAAEEAYWESELDRLAPSHLIERDGAVLLPVCALETLPLAAARRLVRRAVERVKGDLRAIDFGHISSILDMAGSSEGHGRMQAPGLDVFRSFDWLRIAQPGTETLENRNYSLPAPAPGAVHLPGGAAIRLELIEKPETWERSGCVYNSEMGCVDWDRVSGLLEVRNWRPGDRYRPMGSSGEEKIKTLFHEARIPLWERRHWPVLTDGSGIVWSRKFGPAADRSAGPNTRLILAIRETEEPR